MNPLSPILLYGIVQLIHGFRVVLCENKPVIEHELGCRITYSGKVWKHTELLLGAKPFCTIYAVFFPHSTMNGQPSILKVEVCVGLILNPTLPWREFDQSHQLLIFASGHLQYFLMNLVRAARHLQ